MPYTLNFIYHVYAAVLPLSFVLLCSSNGYFPQTLSSPSLTWIRESISINDTARGANLKTWKAASSLDLQWFFLQCKCSLLRVSEVEKVNGLVLCRLQNSVASTTESILDVFLNTPVYFHPYGNALENRDMNVAARSPVLLQLEFSFHYTKGPE